jgi:formate dehydrogenase major subunit
MGGVFDIYPGYLKMLNPTDADLATFLKRTTPTTSKPSEWDSYNYWSNTPKFMVSFLKSLFGDAAKKENDFGFHYLPRSIAATPGSRCGIECTTVRSRAYSPSE